jgi:NADPH:quinone reductase-like Zn-dependent oxidoreductase
MSKPSNSAAFLTAPKAHPLVVQPHPYPELHDGTVIIKTHAIAINPADQKFQQLAMFPLEYPLVLGFDVAGEVVEVGKGVEGLDVGDRVLA